MKRLGLCLVFVLLSTLSGYSQTPLTGCTPGTTVLHGSGALPAFDVQVNGATTCLLGIHLTNTTAGDLVVTLHDAASLFFYQITVLANQSADKDFPNGLEFDNALFWQASGTGVVVSYIAVQ